MSFYRLHFNTQILKKFLIHILYLSSLALCNLVLLQYYFAYLLNLILQLDCFVYLYLMDHSYYMQSLEFFMHLIQIVISCKHLLIFHADQAFYFLKHLEHLKYFKNFKYFKYFKHLKYLDYLDFQFVYLIICFLNLDFCLAYLKIFLSRIFLRFYFI